MARITRRHKIIRILILIAAAFAWMGPPAPPAPPGCPFRRPPRPPMSDPEMHGADTPAAHGAAGAGASSETR
jgi:hypothetical protein